MCDDGTGSGSMQRGTSRIPRSSSSQSSFPMSNIMVRDALEWSVLWDLPAVRHQMSHVSTVPKRSSPFSARSLAPGTLSSIHLSLVPEKYESTCRPVLERMVWAWPASMMSLHSSAVLRSCQTMALHIGAPVPLSHTTAVSL